MHIGSHTCIQSDVITATNAITGKRAVCPVWPLVNLGRLKKSHLTREGAFVVAVVEVANGSSRAAVFNPEVFKLCHRTTEKNPIKAKQPCSRIQPEASNHCHRTTALAKKTSTFIALLNSWMRLGQETHYFYSVFELTNALRPRKPLPLYCVWPHHYAWGKETITLISFLSSRIWMAKKITSFVLFLSARVRRGQENTYCYIVFEGTNWLGSRKPLLM